MIFGVLSLAEYITHGGAPPCFTETLNSAFPCRANKGTAKGSFLAKN